MDKTVIEGASTVAVMYSPPLHDAAQIGSKSHSLDVAFSKAVGLW